MPSLLDEGSYSYTSRKKNMCQRDGSIVKSTCYCCRRSRFISQYPHDGSVLSVTLVSEDPMFSSDLQLTLGNHMMNIHICREKSHNVKLRKFPWNPYDSHLSRFKPSRHRIHKWTSRKTEKFSTFCTHAFKLQMYLSPAYILTWHLSVQFHSFTYMSLKMDTHTLPSCLSKFMP